MKAIDDKDLMLGFLDGNEDAFNELYGRYDDDVRNVIYRYAPACLKGEIEDIIQHFWIGFIKYAHTYDLSRPVRPWLLSCAVKATASYRRLQIPRSRLSLADSEKKLPFDADLDAPSSPERSPVATAMCREDFSHAIEALRRIPTAFSTIIQAVYLKSQTPAQYARENGVPLGTVYTQLNRGMRHLREALNTA